MEQQRRRTKIIATLGPATDELTELTKLLRAGVDVVRVNFSHGKAADHTRRIEAVRLAAANSSREVAILADLQGPKIRIARFQNNKIKLDQGAKFTLDADLATDAGDEQQVGIDYKALPQDVQAGDELLLDDGRIVLSVQAVAGNKIQCLVVDGGELSNHKGINRKGGGLSAKALTEKDIADLELACRLNVDYIGLSFPRSAADINEARVLLNKQQSQAGIIAKIERAEAVAALDEIIMAADGVMVARGDLGVEIGDESLPGAQKRIIQRARALDKTVITATQMMESMIQNTIPTRAEVFDVANAVLDGTDAVMLSAETATGSHPALVVKTMARICLAAEQESIAKVSGHRVECRFQRVDEAIAMATMYIANHLNIRAIVTFTESGATPLWMSRIRSGIPIYALTRSLATQRRMMLYRGVYPVYFDETRHDPRQINDDALAELKQRQIVASGDLVIVTHGDQTGLPGGTNNLKIITVP